MKKKKLIVILCGVMVLGITGCSNPIRDSKKDLDNAKQELEETYNKYGWTDEETINDLIAKYNTEIMDGGLGTPAYDNGMLIENDIYWFALTNDITFYIKPVECTKDKMKDITDLSAVRIDKNNYNEEIIVDYAKKLIKANNNNFTDEEINTFIKEAQELKQDGKMSNNGKGISVGILETNDFYEYQVKRIYK